MNERIKELLTQSGYDARYCSEDFDPEKFAELIVKACADYADMAQDAGCKYAGDYVAEGMGYGVEEGITEWRAK